MMVSAAITRRNAGIPHQLLIHRVFLTFFFAHYNGENVMLRSFFSRPFDMPTASFGQLQLFFFVLFRRLSVDEDFHLSTRGSNVSASYWYSPRASILLISFHQPHHSFHLRSPLEHCIISFYRCLSHKECFLLLHGISLVTLQFCMTFSPISLRLSEVKRRAFIPSYFINNQVELQTINRQSICLGQDVQWPPIA